MSDTETGEGAARESRAAGGTGAPDGSRPPRIAAAVTGGVLFAAVAAVLALTTPWNPLPGHVPGGHAKADPALDFTSAEIARSKAFDSALAPPAYAGLVTGLALILVLGLTPLGARFIGWATSRTGRRPLRIVIATAAVTTLLRVAGLPFDVWHESVLRRYGLSTQSWPSWLVDQLKSLGLTWIIYTVALLLLYALIRRFPRYWWTGAAAGGFLLVVLVSFIYPVAVEPVFNKFHSLPQGRLRTDLLAMAERDGVPVKDVLVADASRRTTSLNAYVSGFGSTRRIVLYDTLLKSPPARIESIVGHELGHAKRDDVLHGTLVGALGIAGAVCVLYLLMTSPRLLRRAGLDPGGTAGAGAAGPGGTSGSRGGAADPRSIALLLALVTVGTHLAAPVQNLVSRRIEARADVHALDLTRDPSTFVSMQHELSVRNISDLNPDGLEYLLWLTHPSGPDRIAMARDWSRMHHVQVPPPLR
ncbi:MULTISPECIES: M48 family metallopeptidase [Actinomadura]|uniref:STE24 endopeptidase n=1 Tax=Actinomadura madurae TaxID=1993 RepID=A0A1I4WYG0_9ACTN|nr:M48 family metallopeptidase [Actinomadura madurae]SFN18761.1 STE24 endopeptidase [Actinomadura madurae]SPT62881.1 heat shock protein HtpX [Actinomadura madurae]